MTTKKISKKAKKRTDHNRRIEERKKRGKKKYRKMSTVMKRLLPFPLNRKDQEGDEKKR